MNEIRRGDAGKRKNEVHVVKGIDLHMDEEGFMVLVGPSGCATSTALPMIADLESISADDLFVGGRRTNEQTSAEHNVSMNFQSDALFLNLSARENRSVGLMLRKSDPSTVAGEVAHRRDAGIGRISGTQAAPRFRRTSSTGGAWARVNLQTGCLSL